MSTSLVTGGLVALVIWLSVLLYKSTVKEEETHARYIKSLAALADADAETQKERAHHATTQEHCTKLRSERDAAHAIVATQADDLQLLYRRLAAEELKLVAMQPRAKGVDHLPHTIERCLN